MSTMTMEDRMVFLKDLLDGGMMTKEAYDAAVQLCTHRMPPDAPSAPNGASKNNRAELRYFVGTGALCDIELAHVVRRQCESRPRGAGVARRGRDGR